MREIRIKKALLTIGVFLHFCLLGWGQYEEVTFEQFDNDNLALIYSNDIFQDSKGYMWFGTLGGLFRYDGYEAKLFTHEPSDSLSISDSKVVKIVEDAEGYLWMSTHNGLNRYDPKMETFKRIYHEPSSSHNQYSSFSQIVGILNGYLWIIYNNEYICKYNLASKQFDHVHHQKSVNKTSIDSIRHAYIDNDSFLYLFRHSGFYVYDSKQNDFDYFEKELKDPTTNASYYFVRNLEGSMWIGSKDELHLFNPKTKQLQSVVNFPDYHNPIRNNLTSDHISTKHGIDWVGTAKGIFLLNHNTQSFRQLKHHPKDYKSLGSNSVHGIKLDNFENIWISTKKGLSIYNPHKKKFKPITTDVISSPLFIREMFEYEEGKLLLWEKGQLMLIDYLNNSRSPFPHQPKDHLEHWHKGVICYFKDENGLIWMGTEGGDVFIFNPKIKQFKFLALPVKYPTGGIGHMIGDINSDAYGDVWITTWGNGVFRYNEEQDDFKHYKWNSKDNKSLVGNSARIIFVDSNKTLWVSTRNGLCKFDYTTESFTRYTHDANDPTSISENTAFAIYESPEGDFWIATYGGGLNKMDRAKGTFEHFTVQDGLSDNGIVSIYPTKDGQLWIHGFKGLNKFDPVSKTFRCFSKKDGLMNNGYSAFSHYKSPYNGYIFAEGHTGIDYFHPDSIKNNPLPPKIYITNLKLDNQEVAIAKNQEELNSKTEFFIGSNISYINKLSIPPNKKVITFEFTGIHFESPENTQYTYKLEGFDKDWQYVGTQRTATYTNLDPGTYNFKVKAANPDGIWNETPAEITVVILPPWWLTWWAKLGYALMAIGSLVWFILAVRQKVKKKEAELAKERAFSQKLEKINRANQRFVPQNFLQILGKKSIEDLKLGDQIQTKMTILFSDIRSYTTMSESMSPEDNFKFINGYLGRIGPIIEKHGGFISQYLGDGLMALFLDNNGAAARAAVDIQQTLQGYNKHRKTKGRPAIQTGIGLNTGQLMLGVIGDKNRYESTVIADAVNTASRMEGLTKIFGAAIILSQRTLAGLQGNFPLPHKLGEAEKLRGDGKSPPNKAFAYRYLGQVKVKGKDKALKIYDLYDGESSKIRKLKAKTRLTFEKGIDFYFNRKFGKAADCFKEVLVIHTDDKAAQYYLDKAVQLIVNGVTEEWSGVEEMIMK